MASIINADNGVVSGSAGLKTSADSTGVLALQTNGTTAVTVDTLQNVTFANSASLPNTFGFKNRIINGDMRIDQRNAGASVTPTDGQYSVDRYVFGVSAASKFTFQQNAGSVTPPTGFTNYLGITSSSTYSIVSGDYFNVNQCIEGFNIADLGWGTANAKTVTLSFWVRSSLTGTFGGSLRNSGSSRSYPFTYTISSANTWEQKSITIAGETTGTWQTTNGIGIRVGFGFGVGSNFSGTAGAWSGANYASATGATSVVGTNGATLYITGVQLEKGSTATSFDVRPYGTELALCQRYYYQRLGFQSVYWDGYAASGTYPTWCGSHPVQMRASPTSAIVGTYTYGNASSISIVATTDLSVNLQAITGGSTGRTYWHSNASAGYSANSEL